MIIIVGACNSPPMPLPLTVPPYRWDAALQTACEQLMPPPRPRSLTRTELSALARQNESQVNAGQYSRGANVVYTPPSMQLPPAPQPAAPAASVGLACCGQLLPPARPLGGHPYVPRELLVNVRKFYSPLNPSANFYSKGTIMLYFQMRISWYARKYARHRPRPKAQNRLSAHAWHSRRTALPGGA